MRVEEKKVRIACDLCGQETADPWNSVSEGAPVGVLSLRYDIWYGGVFDVKDTCRACQAKLSAFLHANKMVGHGQRTV